MGFPPAYFTKSQQNLPKMMAKKLMLQYILRIEIKLKIHQQWCLLRKPELPAKKIIFIFMYLYLYLFAAQQHQVLTCKK